VTAGVSVCRLNTPFIEAGNWGFSWVCNGWGFQHRAIEAWCEDKRTILGLISTISILDRNNRGLENSLSKITKRGMEGGEFSFLRD